MKIAFLAALLLGIGSAAGAQEAPPAREASAPLTLRKCLEIGLEQNYDVRIVRNEERVSDNNATAGNAGMLPTVDLSAGYTGTLDNDRTVTPRNGDATTETGVYDQTANVGLAVNWTLFDGLRIRTNYKRLKEMQQMGALNDALPSLYRLALDTYNSEGDDVVTRIDQLNTQEQNAQAQYNAELSDYYSQLDRKGSAYNAAYEQDYGRYQDYLGRLNTLYGYYSNQEQQAIAKRQQTFNNVLSILGVIGDAVQLAITGTTGIGSLVGTLANTGYNMYAKDRAYAAERADAAWDQQMQETQRQDSLAQQKYKNEQAERQYQDTLRQQEFNNNVTSEKLNIAKGEWALKQSKAAQSAQQAAANAGAKSAGSSGGSGSGSVLSSGGGTIVPYSAARLYRQGRSDTAIRSELLKEGYSNDEVANILKQLGS